MKEFLFYIFIVALSATFILNLLQKWGFIQWVQINGNDFFYKMFTCNFCLSFWTCTILSIICIFISGNPVILLVPICSTVITKNLL